MIDTYDEFVAYRGMMETPPGDLSALVADAPAWHADAACRTADPSLFFPGRGEPSEPAKAICARCPVRAQCLDDAMVHRDVDGIWGGASERERRMIRGGRLSRAELDGRLARAVERLERRTARAAAA